MRGSLERWLADFGSAWLSLGDFNLCFKALTVAPFGEPLDCVRHFPPFIQTYYGPVRDNVREALQCHDGSVDSQHHENLLASLVCYFLSAPGSLLERIPKPHYGLPGPCLRRAWCSYFGGGSFQNYLGPSCVQDGHKLWRSSKSLCYATDGYGHQPLLTLLWGLSIEQLNQAYAARRFAFAFFEDHDLDHFVKDSRGHGAHFRTNLAILMVPLADLADLPNLPDANYGLTSEKLLGSTPLQIVARHLLAQPFEALTKTDQDLKDVVLALLAEPGTPWTETPERLFEFLRACHSCSHNLSEGFLRLWKKISPSLPWYCHDCRAWVAKPQTIFHPLGTSHRPDQPPPLQNRRCQLCWAALTHAPGSLDSDSSEESSEESESAGSEPDFAYRCYQCIGPEELLLVPCNIGPPDCFWFVEEMSKQKSFRWRRSNDGLWRNRQGQGLLHWRTCAGPGSFTPGLPVRQLVKEATENFEQRYPVK